MHPPIRLCVLPEKAVESVSDGALAELLDYADAEVILTETAFDQRRISNHTTHTAVAFDKIKRNEDLKITGGAAGVQLVIAGTHETLTQLATLEQTGQLDQRSETYILTGELTVDIDLVNLETTLNGKSTYQSALTASDYSGSYTHLTTTANPDYRNQWSEDFVVQGVSPTANETTDDSRTTAALLTLYPDGMVSSRSIGIDRFGLQALTQVGEKRAETLRQAGANDVNSIADSSIATIRDISGIGARTAEKIFYSAKALSEDVPFCFTKEGLPKKDPIYIDIETDGLTPTMIWLIGVFDAAADRYMPFIAKDPDEKGKAVSAFMSWLTANAADRPIVAYNGLNFDFPTIADHVRQYCPGYTEDWNRAYTFDPLWWANGQKNAILPGRTNKLDDVASALGWTTENTALSGQVVGERFAQWQQNPSPKTELDWERYKQYCKDDVQALKFILDALREAPVVGSSQNRPKAKSSAGKQGSLGDF